LVVLVSHLSPSHVSRIIFNDELWRICSLKRIITLSATKHLDESTSILFKFNIEMEETFEKVNNNKGIHVEEV